MRGEGSFDRATERRYKDGDIELDGRLDLHGMTQAEAHAALARFIAAHARDGSRHLLIITGKGKEGQGVLRANLRGWLDALPDAARIQTVHSAALRHGGEGAFYVILKRQGGGP